MNQHQKPAQFHLKESTNFQEATDKTENQHEMMNTEKKLSPGIPAPSGFTQPVWGGSKITGNISIKVAIWDAVGKRKRWWYVLVCAEERMQRTMTPAQSHATLPACALHWIPPLLSEKLQGRERRILERQDGWWEIINYSPVTEDNKGFFSKEISH